MSPKENDVLRWARNWINELGEQQAAEKASSGSGSFALGGHELPWREWLQRAAPGAVRAPFAPHHVRAWEWFESLRPGEKPPALVECWPRGHGKSTTVELAISRKAVTADRRFFLYVSCTQQAANRHVQAIAVTMERVGVERAVSPYGYSRGWRGDLLRTANGFNVLAFGLDGGMRGVKLDEIRPDGIILDDVDELGDTADAARKKQETIAQTVLPAGSTDCAVAFFQNSIHAQSVMNRILSGEADLLRRRVQSPIVVAVEGLRYEEVQEPETGRRLWRITAGTPTWEGKPLSVCESEINEFGLVSFLRECQQEVGVGSRFFETWESATPAEESLHEVWSFEIPDHWTPSGGYDWGKAAPAAFYLNFTDDRGNVVIADEFYAAGQTNEQQAEAILAVIARSGRKPADIPIYADPSIFPPRDPAKRVGRYTVEDFWARGLRMIPANNDRVVGWSRVKEYIDARDTAEDRAHGTVRTIAGLRVFKDRCPNLCRTIPLMTPDPRRPEDLDTHLEDHGVDAGFRYSIQRQRQRPARQTADADAPATPLPPDHRPAWMKAQAEKKRTL